MNLCYFSAFKEAAYSGQKALLWYSVQQEEHRSIWQRVVPLEDVSQRTECNFHAFKKYGTSREKKTISHLFYISLIINLTPKSDFKEKKNEGKQWINSICEYRHKKQKTLKH